MKNELKLSIIIVSYNEMQYLPTAIQSCLALGLEGKYEIIIGDDGSCDGSIDLINEYVLKYPHLIRSFVMSRTDDKDIIPSIRVSNVIKRALRMSRGRYVLLLSGDDYFCNGTYINGAISFLDKNPEYAAYVTRYKEVWDSGQEKVKQVKPLHGSLYWGVENYTHISTVLFRRTVYAERLLLKRFCDDTGMTFSIARQGDFYYSDELTFAYRQRKGSIMHKNRSIELHVVELLLMQDILCKGWLSPAVLSRFSEFLWSVFNNRNELKINKCKYRKYFSSAKRYHYNILELINKYDTTNHRLSKFSLVVLLICSSICKWTYQRLYSFSKAIKGVKR